MISQPANPVSQAESDLIWFPVRITSVLGGGAYTFQEVWITPVAVQDKVGGRYNGSFDPAYPIDGNTFSVTAEGSAVQVLARRAMGIGGVGWELKGFGGSSQITVDGSYASDGAAAFFVATTTPQMVPTLATVQLAISTTYLLLANITAQANTAGQFLLARLVSGPQSTWPASLTQHGGLVSLSSDGGFQGVTIPVGPFAEARYVGWEVYTSSGTGNVYGLYNTFTGLFQLGNTSIYSIKTSA